MSAPTWGVDVAVTVEEVEFLVGTTTPDALATRLGYGSFESLARALYRADRPDLVAALTATRR